MSARRPPIIGLTGAKRSGKDTAARTITTYGYVQDSFAAPIRSFVRNLLDIESFHLEEIKDKPSNLLGGRPLRDLMQRLGTEWMRTEYGEDIWIKALEARNTTPISREIRYRLVISDVRFPNEAAWIHSRGGIVIQINRWSSREDSHPSENPLPPNLVDYFIWNDSSLSELRSKVELAAFGESQS